MEFNEINETVAEQSVVKVKFSKLEQKNFIILFIVTFGIYGVWWMYKSWTFFKEKEKSDIHPALRAIFSIFFMASLFEKILCLAKERGYEKTYNPWMLWAGILLLNLSGYLPEPFFLLASFSLVFYLMAFNALNYAVDNNPEIDVDFKPYFNGRQVFLLIAGGIFWALALFGILFNLAMKMK